MIAVLVLILVVNIGIIISIKYRLHKKAWKAYRDYRAEKTNDTSKTDDTSKTNPPKKEAKKKVGILTNILLYSIATIVVGLAIVVIWVVVSAVYNTMHPEPSTRYENPSNPVQYTTDTELHLAQSPLKTVTLDSAYELSQYEWTCISLPDKVDFMASGCIKGIDAHGHWFYIGDCGKEQDLRGCSFEQIKLKAYGGQQATITFTESKPDQQVNYKLPS